MTIFELAHKKLKKEKISMITCYDYSFAKIIAETNIDCLLVGDSLAMTMHGHPTTINTNVEIIALHTAAVVRGVQQVIPDFLKQKMIVADMPFLSYRKDLSTNMSNVECLMKAGAHAVKLEGVEGNMELIKHIVQSGIPVMGHIGLTPQSVYQLGGFKVQGRDENTQIKIIEQALALQDCGCFSVVLECVPSTLAKTITEKLNIPTIGIGAGPDCDGQVLVLQDFLGMNNDFKPKFVKKYFNGHEEFKKRFNQFHEEINSGTFPSRLESYE